MATLDSILSEVRQLPSADQARLLELIQEGLRRACGEDDAAVGTRGLETWTESTKREDWTSFYPDTLKY